LFRISCPNESFKAAFAAGVDQTFLVKMFDIMVFDFSWTEPWITSGRFSSPVTVHIGKLAAKTFICHWWQKTEIRVWNLHIAFFIAGLIFLIG